MRGLLLCAIVALALVGQARADYGGSSGSFVLLDQNAVALTKLIASTNGSRVILGPLGQMSGVVGEGRCWQMNVTILPQTLAVLQEVLAVANATQLQASRCVAAAVLCCGPYRVSCARHVTMRCGCRCCADRSCALDGSTPV